MDGYVLVAGTEARQLLTCDRCGATVAVTTWDVDGVIVHDAYHLREDRRHEVGAAA